MREHERIERILSLIRAQWNQHPDLRLFQLLMNAVGNEQGDPYHIEDDRLEESLRDALRRRH